MPMKTQNKDGMKIIIKRNKWQVTAIFLKEYEMNASIMNEFKIIETEEISPYKIGSTILISQNELKYHKIINNN
jgi:hypothetical protein